MVRICRQECLHLAVREGADLAQHAERVDDATLEKDRARSRSLLGVWLHVPAKNGSGEFQWRWSRAQGAALASLDAWLGSRVMADDLVHVPVRRNEMLPYLAGCALRFLVDELDASAEQSGARPQSRRLGGRRRDRLRRNRDLGQARRRRELRSRPAA